jgi:hypothetical protein
MGAAGAGIARLGRPTRIFDWVLRSNRSFDLSTRCLKFFGRRRSQLVTRNRSKNFPRGGGRRPSGVLSRHMGALRFTRPRKEEKAGARRCQPPILRPREARSGPIRTGASFTCMLYREPDAVFPALRECLGSPQRSAGGPLIPAAAPLTSRAILGSTGLRPPMSDADLLSLVSGFRARAEELLLRAKTMHDVDVRLKLCEIAVSYERLARRIEQREPRKLVTA